MRLISIILIIGTLTRHAGARWLGELFGYSFRGMEYMLSGAYDILLCAVLTFVLWQYKDSLWKRLAIVAMCIGMIEGAQITVCRAATSNITLVPKGTNLCDHLVGFPLGPTMIVLYAVVICYIMARKRTTKE